MKNYLTIEQLRNFKGLNGKYYPFIIESINTEGHDVNPQTEREKLQFLANCIYNEKIKFHKDWLRYYGNLQNCLKDWLQGVPGAINLPIYYSEIMELAVKFNSVPENYTDKQYEKIISNFYSFIACKILQLFSKYDIEIIPN